MTHDSQDYIIKCVVQQLLIFKQANDVARAGGIWQYASAGRQIMTCFGREMQKNLQNLRLGLDL